MTAANIANVAWALQSGKGSAESTSDFRCYMAGGSQPHSETVKEDFEETTGGRMLSDAYISQVSAAGEPEFFLMPEMAGSLLYGVMGAKAVSGAGDPYTHTFTHATSLPYWTFWRMLANGLFEKFVDCKITGAKIVGESGKPIRIIPRIMGLSPSFLTSAEATATIEKTNRFLHYDGSGALLVEGSAVAHIRSFEIDIDNGGALEPGDSLTPYDVSESRLSIVISTEQLVTSFSLWNRLHYGAASPSNADTPTKTPLELAGSPAGLSWTWTRVAASPGPERSLKLAIPRVQVDPFDDQPSTAAEPLRRSVTYRAYAPTDGSTPMTATLKNGTAAYS